MKQMESAKTRIWKGHAKTERGIRHRRNGMECQDYAEMKRTDDRISIALVDGRGDTDVNAKAVKRITKTLNEFMLVFFEEISQMDEKTIAYNLMLQVEREIGEMSKEYEVANEELASTLLAFCIDEKKGKYCAIHLGDGVIALKDNRDTIQPLSMPTNGISSNQTILSTSEDAMSFVKIYRGSIETIKGVMLASDGIYNGREDWKRLGMYFSEKVEDVILEQKVDDQSVITMHV